MNIHDMTKEELLEESLINITHQVLTERRESLTLAELMEEFRKLTGITDKELKTKILQYYTDLNIDGRFLAIEENRWGLREWYPVDQIEEETAPVVKVRKKKKKKKDYDEEEVEEDDEEIFDEEYVELGEEEDDEEDDDEEVEVVEIEEDLIDPEDDLEVIPEGEIDIDEDDDEDEEEEDEEYEEEK